ncbi:MAG: 30S ribosomal protein S12 methylthiotransferase RimO [Deltaproteobacteria bacterium]|nr:30S ribosomal protein S12 methylthiotransferase RimO [Deltaproteobacteria bacterium]
MPKHPEKICLTSLGCPKNLVDSEVMLGILKQDNFELTANEDDADILIVNTCGFIGDAKEESINAILRLAQYKEKGRCRLLIVTGCLVQRYKDELAKEMPEVDFFIGTGEYPKIAYIIKNGSNQKVIAGIPRYVHDYDTPRILATPRYSAYVKIAEGCSNYCSYCTIPSIRGEFRSRSLNSVIKEIENLAQQSVKEINLIAQDSTSYGMDGDDLRGLETLLKRAVKVVGIEWVRLLYLYPGKITKNLIHLIRDEEKICKYIDMPIQHINNRILRAMNRNHTKAQIQEIIKMIRHEIPDAALRTSLIVGFPGETEEEFDELLDFVKTAQFDRLGVFKYSREEGTPAYKMKGQVPEAVKKVRLRKIMEAQTKIAGEKNRLLVGSAIQVLVEGVSEETEFLLKGRSMQQAPDNIDGITYINKGIASPGDIADVIITDAGEHDIVGGIM